MTTSRSSKGKNNSLSFFDRLDKQHRRRKPYKHIKEIVEYSKTENSKNKYIIEALFKFGDILNENPQTKINIKNLALVLKRLLKDSGLAAKDMRDLRIAIRHIVSPGTLRGKLKASSINEFLEKLKNRKYISSNIIKTALIFTGFLARLDYLKGKKIEANAINLLLQKIEMTNLLPEDLIELLEEISFVSKNNMSGKLKSSHINDLLSAVANRINSPTAEMIIQALNSTEHIADHKRLDGPISADNINLLLEKLVTSLSGEKLNGDQQETVFFVIGELLERKLISEKLSANNINNLLYTLPNNYKENTYEEPRENRDMLIAWALGEITKDPSRLDGEIKPTYIEEFNNSHAVNNFGI